MAEKEIIIASPRGFCAGVVRAVETVKKALKAYDGKVYVLHEIVHNKHVIKELEKEGAVFVEELVDIPTGEVVVFSAHGVSTKVEKQAKDLGLKSVDATCPLVSSIHRIVEKYSTMDYDIIIIGHHKHPEVEGTAGRAGDRVHIVANPEEAESLELHDQTHCVFVTQTTLSQDDVDEIRDVLIRRFPQIQRSTSNICYATQYRQDAVRQLAEITEIILVVGSKNSSNSNRLRDVAKRSGVEAYLIDDREDLDRSWFNNITKIGITAGASAPERLVEGVIDWIGEHWSASITTMEGEERRAYFRPAKLED